MNCIGRAANCCIGLSFKAENAKNSVKASFDKVSKTIAGEKNHSFAKNLKKVANIAVNLVKKHPNAVIAGGLFVVALGAVTGNLGLAVAGGGLVATGMWARSSNRDEQVKSAVAEMMGNLDATKNTIAETKQPRSDELQTR